jgi:hypothetical protein
MDPGNNRALRALRAALSGEGAALLTLLKGSNLRRDTLRVRYGTSESILAPVWAGEGFPKDVELAIEGLAKNPLDRRETLVIVARSLSTGARSLLDAQGISWADEEGRAAISASPGLVVLREASSAKARPSTEGMRWSEGTGAVAEYILGLSADSGLRPETGPLPLPTMAAVAGDTNLSAPFVSRTLQAFDAMAWTKKEGAQRGSSARRVLTDATGLLSSWAAWHAAEDVDTVHTHATFRDADTFLRERIGAAWELGQWALTGWLALERRAPFMTTTPVITLYVDREVFEDRGELGSWMTNAGLRKVDSGSRVDLVKADPYVLRRAKPEAGTPQVSDIRLYGDLLRLGVRGSDAAEHLRETRIGF